MALKTPKNIYIAADSAYSENTKRIIASKNESKLLQIKNGVFGFSGDVSVKNVFEVFVQSKTVYNSPLNTKQDVMKLVKKFNLFFAAREYEILNISDEHKTVGMLLITNNKKIFEIGEDGCVIEYDDFNCVGSGSTLALGLLDWLHNNKTKHTLTPEEQITAAVEQAIKYRETCGGRIDLIKL